MSRYIVDYGGNHRGNYAVSRKSADTWFCTAASCRSHQFGPQRARYRATKVRCKKCGALCYRKEERIPKVKVRRCKKCKTVLRSGNPLPVCNPCFNAMGYFQRQRAMGIT